MVYFLHRGHKSQPGIPRPGRGFNLAGFSGGAVVGFRMAGFPRRQADGRLAQAGGQYRDTYICPQRRQGAALRG